MRLRIAMSSAACLLAAACSTDSPTTASLEQSDATVFAKDGEATADILTMGEAINASLEAQGAAYRVGYAEWLGGDNGENLVFFSDRGNKRLGADFVPRDPRRGGRTDITFSVDQTEGAIDGLTTAQTTAAIDRAMSTWGTVACSSLPITAITNSPLVDFGIVETILGQPSDGSAPADINHAGWQSGGFFNALFGPMDGPRVLAVTFTFIFVDLDDAPTDIDNNKYADVAFREILYNDGFSWAINDHRDVETVALHEAGHGLSQGHFGKLFFTTSNEKFHFSPRAVMNAGYTGIQHALASTDEAGHCANWASWPNN